MKKFVILAMFIYNCLFITCNADTLGKYAGISKSIPQARLKADPQAHIWARSAKSILNIIEETIIELSNL